MSESKEGVTIFRRVLTAALNHPVTLCALHPAEEKDRDRRGAPDSADLMTELRSIFRAS